MRTFLAVLVGFVAASMIPMNRQSVSAADATCGKNGKSHMRTTLYFGLSRTGGSISDAEWTGYLRDEVTPRFPNGLTVWDADGQWRAADSTINRERAKVLLVVHDGKSKSLQSLIELVDRYKAMFQQESVLWESAGVCAAF
jgi:hypothetical protein